MDKLGRPRKTGYKIKSKRTNSFIYQLALVLVLADMHELFDRRYLASEIGDNLIRSAAHLYHGELESRKMVTDINLRFDRY